MSSDEILRQQLRTLLLKGNAHMTFDDAVAAFPAEQMNQRAPNVSYTPWHLLEHIRITQWDILDFIRNPNYIAPAWPSGYWPAPDALTDREGWEATIASFHADQRALVAIIDDPKTDLYAPIPHGDGQNILQEILTVADHNAYHIGEFAILRQVMGTWPEGHQ